MQQELFKYNANTLPKGNFVLPLFWRKIKAALFMLVSLLTYVPLVMVFILKLFVS